MAKDSYIVIQSWMISELGLSGNDLLVYAVIYGYSQDGENEYFGSLNNLSALLRLDRSTVIRCLHRLTEAGLIRKRNASLNNVERCFYCAVSAEGVQALDRGSGEVVADCNRWQNATGVVAKCHGGGGKMPPHNNKNNKIIIKEKVTLTSNQKERAQAGACTTPAEGEKKREVFKKPTVEEVAQYCASRANNIDAQHFYDYYEACGWMVGKGKKMKCWQAAIRNWEKNGINTQKNENRSNRLADARADIIAGVARAEERYRAQRDTEGAHAELFFDEV